ncbi:MAG: NAD(P)H-binding protein [Planctomycetes bacterium]|nr:NAD(P)H-binding protein [Planctomycetota bacterium]
MTDQTESQRVLLTGATGFVGGYVLKKLLSSGYVPVCVVRDPDKFAARTELYPGAEIVSVRGDVTSPAAVQKAARQCSQAIHLVGIIMERGENTFGRVHYEGTKNVVQACKDAGIKRLVHMSALGTRPDAVSKYHQSKHMAEQCVMQSGLDWTIFRPSLIHGPEGELMQLLKTFACSAVLPPVMPYFGKGENRVQPVLNFPTRNPPARLFTQAASFPRTSSSGPED